MIHIPRIGQEVIVDFLEGDPDQPIIVGSVYNAEMMPPYTLPANKTQSGIKSRSSLGGGPPNFNEFRFEDKKGSEEVYLHAEKDWNIMVEHDKGQTIGHDETSTVMHDRKKEVKHDETCIVGHDKMDTVVHDLTVTVRNDQTNTVKNNSYVTVGIGKTDNIGETLDVTSGTSITETSKTITVHATTELKLVGPGGEITINAAGITIQGVLVKIN